MQVIQHIELGSDQASITFSSIPQIFTDLLIVASIRGTRTGQRDTPLRVSMNSSGFTARTLYGYSTSVGSQTPTTYIGWIPTNSATAGTFGNLSLHIPNYTATGAKSFSVDIVQEDNQAGAFNTIAAGLTTTTSAITSVGFTDESGAGVIATGSSATLYGILRGSSNGVTVS